MRKPMEDLEMVKSLRCKQLFSPFAKEEGFSFASAVVPAEETRISRAKAKRVEYTDFLISSFPSLNGWFCCSPVEDIAKNT